MLKRPWRLAKAALNLGLRPLGGEVVRLGWVESQTTLVGDLKAELTTREQHIRELGARAEALTGRRESPAVEHALALSSSSLAPLQPTAGVLTGVMKDVGSLTSHDIFFYEGEPLPCWRPEDLGLYDDWLENPTNYPAYFRLFELLASQRQSIRFLEIGVRTGYIAVTLARALDIPTFYMGVDPNEYVANGLDLASRSLRFLREHRPHFEFSLLEGYSWNRSIQADLRYNHPFDVIHVDGDHSLEGKLIDLDLASSLLARGGLVLVDDFVCKPAVSDAIQRACALGWYRSFEHIATLRGLAVLQV